MKKTLRLFGVIALVLCLHSCASDTKDEPKVDNPATDEKEDPGEYRSDWCIDCYETSIQQPDWNRQENNTAEFLAWKEKHKQYLWRETEEGNHRYTTWNVPMKNCTRSEVDAAAVEFVKFTMDDKSNAPTGIDLFTADVSETGSWYMVSYSCSTETKDTKKNPKWDMIFQLRSYRNDTYPLGVSEEIEKWKADNAKYLSEHRTSKDEYGETETWQWSVPCSDFSFTTVDEMILPFVKMSRKNDKLSDHSSYDELVVTVVSYETGVWRTYIKKEY